MLRSAVMAGVVALGCVGISQPADAQRFYGDFRGGRFDHGGFGGNRFFFGFGFPGYGFGGYPYYPAYYYPPYYSYPYYPPYPAAYSGTVTPTGPTATVDLATVRGIQVELQRRGFEVGSIDGRLGPRTKAAIRDYEQQNGLAVDGLPSRSLREHLQSHPTG